MRIPRFKQCVLIVFGAFFCLFLALNSRLSEASLYGRGTYGNCTYSEPCSISVATSGTVSLNATPGANSVYSIAGDTVEVTTNSTGGYSLSLNMDSSTENTLVGANDSIAASSGTLGSPVVLALNSWGFRIDGLASFGSGPTAPITSQPSSALTFAGVPLLASPATIKTTATSAPSGDITEIWYGVRADSALESGLYSGAVTYTAVAL